MKRVTLMALVVVVGSLTLPGGGTPTATVGTAQALIRCDAAGASSACGQEGMSAYQKCINARENARESGELPIMVDGHRDCPTEGSGAYEGCMFSSGCGYDDFPGDQHFPWG